MIAVAIIVPLVVLGVVGALIALFIYRRKNKNKKDPQALEMEPRVVIYVVFLISFVDKTNELPYQLFSTK